MNVMFHVYFKNKLEPFIQIRHLRSPNLGQQVCIPGSVRDKNCPGKLYKRINLCLIIVSGNWPSQLWLRYLTVHFSLFCKLSSHRQPDFRSVILSRAELWNTFWKAISINLFCLCLLRAYISGLERGISLHGLKLSLWKSTLISLALHEEQ